MGRKKRNKQAIKPVDAAIIRVTDKFTPVMDKQGNAYVWLPGGWHPLDAARDHLTLELFTALGGVPPSREAIARTEGLIRAFAVRNKVDMRKRVRTDAGRVLVALGEGRVAEITPGGWDVREMRKEDYLRGDMPTLPTPEPADIQEVFAEFAALTGNLSEEDRLLAFAWTVAALGAHICKGLLVVGAHEAGKTTVARIAAVLADGGDWEARAEQYKKLVEDLAIAANYQEVCLVDNISHLSQEESDALCRVITGSGQKGRKLYTNAGLHTIRSVAKVIITGIAPTGIRPDLASRLLRLRVRLPKHKINDAYIEARVEEIQPAFLGAAFDIISRSLREKPRAQITRMYRWEHIMRVTLSALGVQNPDALLRTKEEESYEEDELLAALVELVHQRGGELRGTASDLTRLLKEEEGVEVSERGLGKLLRTLETSLARKNIRLEWKLSGGRTIYTLTLREEEPEPEPTPQPEPEEFGFEEASTASAPTQEVKPPQRECFTCNWYAPAEEGATCWVEPGPPKMIPHPEKGCPRWQPDDRFATLH